MACYQGFLQPSKWCLAISPSCQIMVECSYIDLTFLSWLSSFCFGFSLELYNRQVVKDPIMSSTSSVLEPILVCEVYFKSICMLLFTVVHWYENSTLKYRRVYTSVGNWSKRLFVKMSCKIWFYRVRSLEYCYLNRSYCFANCLWCYRLCEGETCSEVSLFRSKQLFFCLFMMLQSV